MSIVTVSCNMAEGYIFIASYRFDRSKHIWLTTDINLEHEKTRTRPGPVFLKFFPFPPFSFGVFLIFFLLPLCFSTRQTSLRPSCSSSDKLFSLWHSGRIRNLPKMKYSYSGGINFYYTWRISIEAVRLFLRTFLMQTRANSPSRDVFASNSGRKHAFYE